MSEADKLQSSIVLQDEKLNRS